MEERLKNLKKSMKKTVFVDLTFTDDHKRLVKQKLNSVNGKPEEEILLAVLQLLSQEKTGFELNGLLRARGIQRYENQEGELYMFLHRLEQKGFIQSRWQGSDEKYYLVSNKGKKLLSLAEETKFSMSTVLKELLER